MTLGGNSAQQLMSIIERVENLNEQKAALSSDIKDIMAEAKSAGFDGRAIKAIIKRRKQDADDLAQHEAIVDAYMVALGDFATSPLGQAAIKRAAA